MVLYCDLRNSVRVHRSSDSQCKGTTFLDIVGGLWRACPKIFQITEIFLRYLCRDCRTAALQPWVGVVVFAVLHPVFQLRLLQLHIA